MERASLQASAGCTKSTMSTSSLPPAERQSWVLNEPVVGVRVVGTVAPEHDFLLAGRGLYHVGSKPPTRTDDGAGSIVIDHPHVSAKHCTIELRNGRWIVVDRESRNGIFVNDEHQPGRRTMIELVPGLEFRLGPVPLVAYSDAGRRARAKMQRYFGLTNPFQLNVEAMLRLASERRHVVLVEPPGGGGLRIARALHDASPRATWPLLQVDDRPAERRATVGEIVEQLGTERDQLRLVDRAAYGTLVIAASALPEKRTPPILDWLASWQYPVRLIVVAPKGTRLAPLLGERLLTETTIIPIPSLAERKAEVGALAAAFAHDVVTRLGRMDIGLTSEDTRIISSREWPMNVEELEKYVERLLALRAHEGRIRQTAKWLGVAPSTIDAWKTKYNVV